MSALITLVWVAQSIVLLVLSFACFFAPETFLTVLWGGDPAGSREAMSFVVAESRVVVPLLLGVSLCSSAASMREDERVRRQMARAFALMLGLCVYLFVIHDDHVQQMLPALRLDGPFMRWLGRVMFLPGHAVEGHGVAWHVVAGVAFVAFTLQALYGMWPQTEAIAPRLSGTADTKPPPLWALWVVQGIGFIAAGMVLWCVSWKHVVAAEYVDRVATIVAATDQPAGEFVLDLHGALYIGLGMFSLFATGVEREWHWQLYSGIFALVAGASLLAMIFVWNSDLQLARAALPMLPMLAMLLANGYFWRGRRNLIAEEIGHGPDGWTLLDVPAGPFLLVQSLATGRRATHLMGVAARGTFRVVDEPRRPSHDFFKANAEHPLQARFAALSHRDDACNDLRGAAIRLSGHVDTESSFDMLMNAGSFSGPEDMVMFTLGVFTRFLPQSFFYDAVRKNRQLREGLIAGRRRAPECVTMIHYYSQVVRFWIDTNDVRWLVRYRLLDPTRPESGLADAKDLDEIWIRERRKNERRPSDYLRTELKRRLAGDNTITMRFQGQFHRPRPGDTLDWYNVGVDWPVDEHPWLDIATVTLEEPLPDEEAERLRFNAANHPPSLGIPAASGAFDYRSLGDSERRIIRRLAELRMWMYRVRGFPRFGNTMPDERGR